MHLLICLILKSWKVVYHCIIITVEIFCIAFIYIEYCFVAVKKQRKPHPGTRWVVYQVKGYPLEHEKLAKPLFRYVIISKVNLSADAELCGFLS